MLTADLTSIGINLLTHNISRKKQIAKMITKDSKAKIKTNISFIEKKSKAEDIDLKK